LIRVTNASAGDMLVTTPCTEALCAN